jgi:Predicted membrane protein
MGLFRQGSQFLIIGLLQLALDWAVFVVATALGMPPVPGNVLARSAGALLGFWLNGRYTFASAWSPAAGLETLRALPRDLGAGHRLSTWLVAMVAAALGLQLAWLAKPLVEGALAVLSFFLLRHVVYR